MWIKINAKYLLYDMNIFLEHHNVNIFTYNHFRISCGASLLPSIRWELIIQNLQFWTYSTYLQSTRWQFIILHCRKPILWKVIISFHTCKTRAGQKSRLIPSALSAETSTLVKTLIIISVRNFWYMSTSVQKSRTVMSWPLKRRLKTIFCTHV